MYFKNRLVAGQELAEKLEKFHTENCVVMTLSDGGALIGAEIAKQIHCSLTLLLTQPIRLPGEPEPIAMMDQLGNYTDNNQYSQGEIEEFESEYYHYIEQKKLEQMHELNRLIGKGGIIKRELLRNHIIILVSDGLPSGFSLDAAIEYLKPIHIKKLIVATPIASLTAVDRMHTLADEIYVISVIENYIGTDHYYEENKIPDHDSVINIIDTITLHWK